MTYLLQSSHHFVLFFVLSWGLNSEVPFARQVLSHLSYVSRPFALVTLEIGSHFLQA
jgi:hypothetical protein